MVWRWGLVVNESMVTRRLRGVESISMDLETVRLSGEDLFYREELERWGVVVQSLRQRHLHHLFVLFKPLRYPCRGRHGVLERWLVQPGHSVRNLCITQVQQRGPGRSLSLGRIDLVRSLGRSDSLPEDFILCCRDLLAVTLSILVLRNGSLGIHVQRCTEVEWRLISCCGLHWRGSGEWGAWSWIPGLAVVPGSSHGRSGWSHGSPGLSLGLLGPSDERTDGTRGVWRNLSGDLGLLSGDPADVANLLLVESCPGTGKDDWTGGLLELSWTLGWSKRHWSNVHIEIKSTSVDWSMVFGMDGRSGGVLVPVRLETSGPPTGVSAGFPCPADPCTPAAGRGAGPSESSGSSKRNCELTQSRHLLGCHCPYQQLWSGRPLWQGRHLWPSRPLLLSRPLWLGRCLWLSRPLWPGRCLWPSHNLWSGRCLWPCGCALPGRHLWPSRRLLPGPHLLSRPLPGPGLELLGPIQHESGGAARQPPWSYASQGPWTWQEIAGHPVWRQTSHPSYRNSLVVSHGDWAETCGLETPVMKMMRGINDRPKNDDDGERKSPTGRVSDALETLPDSARLRELAPPEELGRARSLSLRSLLWPSRRDDWCLGDSWRFSSPCLLLRSGVLDLRWSGPWELGRPTAVTLEATDLGWEELVAVFDRLALDESSDLVCLVGKASLGACNSTESSMISLSFFAAFAAAAALRRFLCAVALACAVQASGSQSLHTRQGLSWVQSGKPSFKRHCWQWRRLSFLRRKWEHSRNFGCDSVDDDLSHDLSAIFSHRHGLPKT